MDRKQKIAVAKVAGLLVITIAGQVIVRKKITTIINDAFIAPLLETTN